MTSTIAPHRIAGERDEVSPLRPAIATGASSRTVGANGAAPGGSTSDAFTIRRSAAEYFGLHVVSVSVAAFAPGMSGSSEDSSTSTSSGDTTNGGSVTR